MGTEELMMRGSDLRSFSLDPVKDGLECRLAETALDAGLFVILVSLAESLWSVVESITKRFVDASQGVTLGHEDLERRCWLAKELGRIQLYRAYPFKSRGACPGMGHDEDGFSRHLQDKKKA